MEAANNGSGGSLVLDVRSRAAFVHGQRVELSPKEFELLSELAARPGEPIGTEELRRSVWPDSFGMTSQEVRWHIWRLRRAIGDDKRESRIVANRRGFGYLIDLAPQEVQLLDPQVSSSKDGEEDPSIHDARTTLPEPSERLGSRRRKALVLLSSGTALVLLAAAWVSASRRSGTALEPRPPTVQQVADESQEDSTTKSGDTKRSSQGGKRKGVGRDRSRRSSDSGPVRDAFSSGATGYPVTSSGTNPSDSSPERPPDRKHGSQGADNGEEPPAPQPNADLLHLYNPDTGDHFVTTSSSAANQKQASGYELIVEGGVFTDQVKGTAAIALDEGTAYIFKEKGSTSGTSVAPLYRMEKDGDFFYTSSSAAANQAEAQGWTRATVGYVTT